MVPTFDRQGNMFQPWYNAGILPLVRELCPNTAIANNSGDNVNVGNEPAINDMLIYDMDTACVVDNSGYCQVDEAEDVRCDSVIRDSYPVDTADDVCAGRPDGPYHYVLFDTQGNIIYRGDVEYGDPVVPREIFERLESSDVYGVTYGDFLCTHDEDYIEREVVYAQDDESSGDESGPAAEGIDEILEALC